MSDKTTKKPPLPKQQTTANPQSVTGASGKASGKHEEKKGSHVGVQGSHGVGSSKGHRSADQAMLHHSTSYPGKPGNMLTAESKNKKAVSNTGDSGMHFKSSDSGSSSGNYKPSVEADFKLFMSQLS